MAKKQQKRIKNNSNSGAFIACAFCKSRGVDPFEVPSKLSLCQVCKGRKKNFVLEPFEKCPVCLGGGIYKHHRLSCAVCKGRGWLHKIPGKDRTQGCAPENKEMLDIETGLPCLSAYDLTQIKNKGN